MIILPRKSANRVLSDAEADNKICAGILNFFFGLVNRKKKHIKKMGRKHKLMELYEVSKREFLAELVAEAKTLFKSKSKMI